MSSVPDQTAPEQTVPDGAPRVFDLYGPLPTGTTVLEASAGTGKTYTIAALTVRYVAEGVATLPELLVVTFGRKATNELRDRVHARLVSAERGLRAADPAASEDELVRFLAAVGQDEAGRRELERRRARLARALAEVDAATITTTHGFCQQMLRTLGTTTSGGLVDPTWALLPDVHDLETEVTDDLYLRSYATHPQPVLGLGEVRELTRKAISDHAALLLPPGTESLAPDDPVRHRVGVAAAARRELVRRKRAGGVVDYDDLLVLLRDALTDPLTGEAASQRVRDRYRVVMVDEFQDTDPVQWDVLDAAFTGHRTMVLIGDPKQAIYGFRGGDVAAYLKAGSRATARETLSTSWRTDAPTLQAVEAVIGGAALGDPRIVVHPVRAAHSERRLVGGPPLRVRRVTRAALGASRKVASVKDARPFVHDDVVAQTVRILTEERLLEEPADGRPGTWRAVRPGDVAVLVSRNAAAADIQERLLAAGVPAVVSAQTSVFATPAAHQWLTLLAALASTGNPGRVAAAALTPFVGWGGEELALATDDQRQMIADRLRGWAHVLEQQGVAALLEAAATHGLAERLLARPDGERQVTDVRHVGEALDAAMRDEGLGAAALVSWLRSRIADAEVDFVDERSRRLETDAEAVQIVTVHTSKGLEFPVVLAPSLWDRWVPGTPKILSFHDDAGTRCLHVGGPESPGYAEGRPRHDAEDAGEDLREAYVALTRAAHQVVVWWAPTSNTTASALQRLVLGERGPGGEVPPRVPVPVDEKVGAAFDDLVARSGGTVEHETVDGPAPVVRWRAGEPSRDALAVARWDRSVDAAWRRTSYTGLTAAAHGPRGLHGQAPGSVVGPPPGVADEPEITGIQDEPDAAQVVAQAAPGLGDVGPGGAGSGVPDVEARLRAVRSPLADLPGGTAFGTLVHDVLEHVDTGAPDLRAEVLRRCEESGLAPGVGVSPAEVADALLPALHTPCGALLGGRTLAQVPVADRLAELEFELPLAGGDAPGGNAPGGGAGRHGTGRRATSLGRIGALVTAHLPADDPFAGYGEQLVALATETQGDAPVRGYLTGSIDAVLRVWPDSDDAGARTAGATRPGHAGADARYVVVDYKTNRLAPPDAELTAWDYRPDALVAAMQGSHYPLQLLLYTVALHRYLRWRLPGYDPERHLGGGLYLFVRGMTGPGAPVVADPRDNPHGAPTGVLSWRPPTSLVLALSAELDGSSS